MEFKWLNKSLIKQTKDRTEIMAPAGPISSAEAWTSVRRGFFRSLSANPVIKLGLLAQAPAGSGGIRAYENLGIEKKTVSSIRAGK